MSNKHQVADEIRRLGRTFRNLIEFAEELDRVGSLENVVSEAEIRKNKAASEEAEAKKALVGVLTKIDDAKKRGADAISKAEGKAADIVRQATEQAEQTVMTAQQAIAKEREEATSWKKALDSRAAERTAENVALEKEIAAKKDVLASLERELEKIRKRVAA